LALAGTDDLVATLNVALLDDVNTAPFAVVAIAMSPPWLANSIVAGSGSHDIESAPG
jgi:hypothetical protein